MSLHQTVCGGGSAFVKAIREVGRTPVQRNTFYEPIKIWESLQTATETESPTNKSKVLEDNLATA